jgi:PKD repeat protein
MTTRRFLVFLALFAALSSAFLLPGCVRFDGVVDFEADVLAGRKPLPVQFTLRVQGCIDRCLWSFGDGTFSTERNPVHTYEQAGSYTVILTVTPCRGEATSARKDDYITVTSGFGSPLTRMWCYYGDNERHRIWRSELVPPFEGQNSGANEVLSHTIGVPHDFVLRGTMLFWTDQAVKKIFAADVTPGRPDNVTTVVTCGDAPHGLAIDPVSLDLYWAEDDPGSDSFPPTNFRIMRANANDGAGVAELLFWFAPIEDLAFDAELSDLYFVGYHAPIELIMNAPQEIGDYVIARVGKDGSGYHTIVSESGQITDIAIHPLVRKVYWFNAYAGEIRRANLDGTDVETIVSDVPGVSDLAVDELNQRIVWASYGNGVARIASAALDGSDVRYRLGNAMTAHYTAIVIGPKPPWTPADLTD